MPRLAVDIYSKLNRNRLWGTKGTEVEIVNDYHGVFIVRPVGKTDGFAVLRHELEGMEEGDTSVETPADPPPVQTSDKAPGPRKSKPASKPSPSSPQSSLF